MKTMRQYIRKTPEIALPIIDGSDKLFEPAVRLFRQTPVSRIILIASGTSSTSCKMARPFFEELLGCPASVEFPFPFVSSGDDWDPSAFYILVTQMGTGPETIRAAEKLTRLRLRHICLTSKPQSPAAMASGLVADLSCGDEKVGNRTMGCTISVLDLFLFVIEAARGMEKITAEEQNALKSNLRLMMQNMPHVIDAADSWFDAILETIRERTGFIFLGTGNKLGAAEEGMLKACETSGRVTCSWETEEYWHGPEDGLPFLKDSICLFLLDSDENEQRHQKVLGAFERIGKTASACYMITNREAPAHPNVLVLPSVGLPCFSVLEYLIPMQLAAARLSKIHEEI